MEKATLTKDELNVLIAAAAYEVCEEGLKGTDIEPFVMRMAGKIGAKLIRHLFGSEKLSSRTVIEAKIISERINAPM